MPSGCSKAAENQKRDARLFPFTTAGKCAGAATMFWKVGGHYLSGLYSSALTDEARMVEAVTPFWGIGMPKPHKTMA
jgi:hypothetical protein